VHEQERVPAPPAAAPAVSASGQFNPVASHVASTLMPASSASSSTAALVPPPTTIVSVTSRSVSAWAVSSGSRSRLTRSTGSPVNAAKGAAESASGQPRSP
jgi:hypothetical protein